MGLFGSTIRTASGAQAALPSGGAKRHRGVPGRAGKRPSTIQGTSRLVFAALVAVAGAGFAAGCMPGIDVDDSRTPGNLGALPGPTVEFDPAGRVLPFPNNLLLNPASGKVTLPARCGETDVQTALREDVLNRLDGFGTYKPLVRLTFSEAPKFSSLQGKVFIYETEVGGEAIDPTTATALPTFLLPSETQRTSADCSQSVTVPAVMVMPAMPLRGNASYSVVVLDGVTTEDGTPFLPSSTWSFVRQSEPPVTVDNGRIVEHYTPLNPLKPEDRDKLLGLDLLWRSHAKSMVFLEQALQRPRSDVLLAWSFRTQTVVETLDYRVPGSPASLLNDEPLVGMQNAARDGEGNAIPPAEYMAQVLGQAGCAAAGCNAVGAVLGGMMQGPDFQTAKVSDLGGPDVPGPWNDPVRPSVPGDAVRPLSVLAFVPAGPAPEGGFPTVVYGHGLRGSKEDLFAVASQLATAGMASVAVSWVAHGDRAVQVDTDATAGCTDGQDPSRAPQCFAPIFSSDLASTRDNLRQSVLDAMGLIKAVRACGVNAEDGSGGCGLLRVNADQVGYMGMSLGAILGSVVVTAMPEVRAAVFNVGGVGLVDVIENTDSLAIRCPLVDALIQAGNLPGVTVAESLAAGRDPQTGAPAKPATCTGVAWRNDAGWKAFGVMGRWVLDPIEPANFVPGLRFHGQNVMVQQVIGDTVVPNVTTDTMGGMLGLRPTPAGRVTAAAGVSPGLQEQMGQSVWMTYETLAAEPDTDFLGNLYDHGTLLRPASTSDEAAAGVAGQLATARMQQDAVGYLLTNLTAPRRSGGPGRPGGADASGDGGDGAGGRAGGSGHSGANGSSSNSNGNGNGNGNSDSHGGAR